ncbi:uncharacterized protein [Antedon mediterranea]|uniref:uncharacterized protein n=1 Tax=Antedon mediterranea TaxID=105859 RepID=UPI003AF4D63F
MDIDEYLDETKSKDDLRDKRLNKYQENQKSQINIFEQDRKSRPRRRRKLRRKNIEIADDDAGGGGGRWNNSELGLEEIGDMNLERLNIPNRIIRPINAAAHFSRLFGGKYKEAHAIQRQGIIPHNDSVIRLQDIELRNKTPDLNELAVMRGQLLLKRTRRLRLHPPPQYNYISKVDYAKEIRLKRFPLKEPLPAIGTKRPLQDSIADEDDF